MGQEAAARAPIAGVIVIIGGAVAAVGSFLPWVGVTIDPSVSLPPGTSASQSIGGLNQDSGKITLILGIVAIVAGLVMLSASSRGLRRGMAALALVAGLLVGGVVALNLATRDSQLDAAFDDQASLIAGQIDAPPEEIEAQMREVFTVGYAFGIYIALLGGAVALVGGVMGVASKGDTTAAATTADADWAPAARDSGAGPDLGPSPDSGPGGDMGVPPPPMP
ncbi:MAG: hypothetical protein WD004_01105 [Actinomycetota bacterium]